MMKDTARIIDFQEAKLRLRPPLQSRAFIVLEIPDDLARELEAADAVDVLAQFDFLIH